MIQSVEPPKIAIPTEYDGVLFRSKSEAVIARTLDLFKIQWEYEHTASADWKPDFKMAVPCMRLATNTKGLLFAFLEYKPSEPTEAHKAEIARKYTESVYANSVMLFLVWGSPFSPGDYGERLFDDGLWCPSEFLRLNRKWTEALAYRFDLKHQ